MKNNCTKSNCPNNNTCAGCAMSSGRKKPKQRVRFEDAITMFKSHVDNFRDKHWPNMTYEEDAAGGSEGYVRQAVVEDFIKRLTR